jgi:hypothetical protein
MGKRVYTHQRNAARVYSIFIQEMSTTCGTQTCLCLISQSLLFCHSWPPSLINFGGPPRGYWCQQGKTQGVNMKICVKCAKEQLMGIQTFVCNMEWNLKQCACVKPCYWKYWAFNL